MTVLGNFNSHCSLHLVVSHSKFFVCRNHFFYSICVGTNFCIVKWQFWEGNITVSIIFHCFNFVTSSIFQYEAEFACSQFTTSQFLSEVKFRYNWRNHIVVKLSVFWHCNSCAQETCSCIFGYINGYDCVHWIVVDVCICSSFFTHSVSVFTYSVVFNRIKCDRSICCIFLGLDHIAIFKQFECEGILCKLFPFKTFSELELSLSCSRCEGVVELCICRKCVCCFKNMTFLSNSDCYFSFHWVVSHASFFIFWDNFFYSVLVSTNLSIIKGQIIKGYNTLFSIGLGLKSLTIWIFQYKAEFAFFQLTACKGFAEVETSLNWSYCKVVKLCIFRHCNLSSQDTRCSIFRNVNFYDCIHIIVVDVCICSSYFTYSISVWTFFIVRNRVELDGSISRIFLRLDDITIFNQFKCEGILRELFPFQFLSELELSLCSNRCEGIVELCIWWKSVSCFKNMTFLRNFNRYFSLHCIVSHTSFFIFWNNFFYSVFVITNLSIVKGQIIKGYNTFFSICLSLKNFTSWIFQYEAKFTGFQLTTCESLAKVKLSFNWSYNVVVEDFIICAWGKSTSTTVFNCSLQITFRVFSYSNSHLNCHTIVIDVCIWSFNLSNCVSVSTNFIEV